jgi:phospholipase/lecithinase/hemolysin
MTQQQKFWRPVVILLFCLLPCLAYTHEVFDRIVVFGDSLSDPGNAYYLLGTELTPPYETLDTLLIPDAPYAVSGHNFSNGPTWIEQLARTLDLKSSVGPAFADDTHGHNRGTNYAVGGACARNRGSGIDLTDQVNVYLSRGPAAARGDDLYVIEFGSNDVRDAIAALALDLSGGASTDIITAALSTIADNIVSLYASGARTLLIGNAPDLSLTPAIRTLDVISPGSAMAAAIIAARFNASLDRLIAQLDTQLPGISITKFDIYNGLFDIVADPGRYRLDNVTDACVMPNVPPYSCRNAKRYLFWDGIHPTKTGHGVFARFARDALFPHGVKKASKRWTQQCRWEHTGAAACRH